jgi:antagonist of KipI
VLVSFIRVVDGGALTLVQDLGRWRHTHLGVPVCGPMDPFAFRAANVLVGNEAGAAELEITAIGPTVTFEGMVFIAITGADLGPRLDGVPLDPWRPHLARPGSELRFTGRRSGARAYLAISGGLGVEPWLGSRSTYLKGGAGGFLGRALEGGDRVPIAGSHKFITSVAVGGLSVQHLPAYSNAPTLRVILGPHANRFTPAGCATFLGSAYRLTEQCDRMGYRLDGPVIAHSGSPDVSSCGIPLGAIQVPGNGRPILLMADHQTVGGYPLIAAVIQADIPLAAQCLPGDHVTFRAVELREAQRALREQFDVLSTLSVGP